ncbi:thioredoxin domain-containing protein [Shewanella sp. NKUCC05_KAH]|uniref:thioredoxin domain-containing protein n=1 Tax=unclassified Shewanella TaxID=196818 RepID=UPI001C5A9C50|nr:MULTISPECIES: thioredoxin domain-containing protein [unclassified Shewanella]MBW3517186.1 thioredoxin domain-containing protein [Shewanella sp. NKUCC01_JLK]MBW3528658.1 thioredoxin domain-containing protein [Shewanella sp. NKUCC05_KAH]
MLKKILTLSGLLLSLTVTAGDYTEGVHYIDLKENSFKADNQVVKIYSANCPFCYKYESAVIPNLEKNLQNGMTFDAYHISTKPPFGKEKATVIAIAKIIGPAEYKKIKMSLYSLYHDEQKKFANSDEVYIFGAKALNMSIDDFMQKADTPEVKALLNKWDNAGVEIAKIQGIPALVVNGKYLIKTSKISSMTMLDDLVKELSTK